MTAAFRFRSKGDFQRTLQSRVDEYFASTGHNPRVAASLYVKAAMIGIVGAASYVWYLNARSWWEIAAASIVLGLAVAAVGFNIQHDGNHGSFSPSTNINRLAGSSLDFIGGSSYFWRWKHNYYHHGFPNIDGIDTDVDLGFVGRLHDGARWRPAHRFQHFYLWVLYALIAVKWQLFDDFQHAIRGRIGDHAIPPMDRVEVVRFIAGKVIFAVLAFVIPLFFHPPLVVLGAYFLGACALGFTLSVVFQLAHCVEGLEAPQPSAAFDGSEWAEHQLATTANFAPRSRLITGYVGGLNFQIEHHLMPNVAHAYYPSLAPIVQRTCEEFGLRYVTKPTMWQAVVSHYRWLARFSTPATAPALAPASPAP